MRNIEFINREWLYKKDFKNEYLDKDFDYSEFEKIELPHTNIVTPYNYFDENIYQFISTYIKKIYLSSEYKNKKIFLDFEGVMGACKVYCNGKFVCEHKGGYTFFEADISDYVEFDNENMILVEVDSTERKDIPPYGNVVDFLTYGGIYREVSLRIVEQNYIKNAFIKSNDCLDINKSLSIDLYLELEADVKYSIKVTLLDENDEIVSKEFRNIYKDASEKINVKLENLNNIDLWDLENPKLYNVEIKLFKDDCLLDVLKEKTGFRNCIFKPDGFYLNNKKIKLIGLNRHQSYPYVGYAMPKRVQCKDADILKYDMGVNIVRCSHYPQSKHFLNRCDEIGLLVFDEIPGWQHIGDEKWQDVAIKNVEEMITRNFNHPSIIIWGVRINESRDDHKFYAKTNEIAHLLDDTRQTGGVRYSQKSELLEDVYTFNDFVHSGGKEVLRDRKSVTGLDYDVPLLVTENNGHMYPTKRFDHESKLVEHSIRHLKVINEAKKRDDIVGSISWCAFDYNTHSSFGSGDKICYHGVCDMFRIPKYAANSYSSQKSPKDEVVLEVISVVSRGEKDGGGIVPFNILTNCDYIKVYKNGSYVDKFYPQKDLYEGLEHPPISVNHLLPEDTKLGLEEADEIELKKFIIDKITSRTLVDMNQEDYKYLFGICQKYDKPITELMGIVVKVAGGWGDESNLIKIEGYVNEECVITKDVGEIKSMQCLDVKPDDAVLYSNEESYDATRVVVKVLDTLNNITPFINEYVEVEIDGPLKVMGPDKFALQGGCSAFWVKTTGENGIANIKLRSMYFETKIKIEVK